jgi:Kef-type K+ transport system membrane component KefB
VESGITNLLVVAAAIVVAPILAHAIPRVKVPVVVVEIAVGIVIGPQVLGLASVDSFVLGLAKLGLAFLFFLAGFEIDFGKIRGLPLKLGGLGWLLALVISIGLCAVLYLSGVILLVRYLAIAITSTAIGTLMPILRDAGDVETPFGRFILAAGAVGEFGPIVLTALLLSAENKATEALLLLMAFGVIVLAGLRLAERWRPQPITRLAKATMHSSAQLPVRLTVLVLIAMSSAALALRLEFLLGAFAAGAIVAQAIKDVDPEDLEPLRVKYEGLSFGLFIPIFFVVTGMQFDLRGLLSSPLALAMLPMFLLFFLLVRGVPALWLYRGVLGGKDRQALGLYAATQLPILVAISELAVEQGQMRPEIAAALIGAGMLSVFIFPLLALGRRRAALPAAAKLA